MHLTKPLTLGIGLALAALFGTAAAQDTGTLRKIKDSGVIQI